MREILPLLLLLSILFAGCAAPTDIPPAADTPIPATAQGLSTELASFTSTPTEESTNMSPETFSVTSPAFENGGMIPEKYTCDGDNLSPELRWQGLPADARSLALVVEDPDAPSGTFIHWVIYNIAPTPTGLPTGVGEGSQISGVGTQGVNGFRRNGYGGPCPPKGAAHRYYFKLYALDLAPNLESRLGADDLQRAMKDHILAQAEWMGRYQRR